MAFQTEQILWYNVGVWGQLGYACPNFGNCPTTLNNNIGDLVSITGRNLFAIMQHSDADLRTPPSINTVTRIHKLCIRVRQILSARALAPAQLRMEPVHATPAPQDFLIYPCPFFKVRNEYMKTWAQLVLNAIAEATQHTENRNEYEISTAFAGTFGQYLQRIYQRLATELFGVDAKTASDPAFTLTPAQLGAYDPSQWFTSTELVDTLPPPNIIPTADDMRIIADGIPASRLANLQAYPTGAVIIPGAPAAPAPAESLASGAPGSNAAATFDANVTPQGSPNSPAKQGAAAGTASTGAFIPPPGP